MAMTLRLTTAQEERTIPTLQPTEVLVAVKSTGLCGSDLHYYSHYRNGDIQVRQPMTLGHESAGTVTAVGSGVTGLKPGDNVALEVGLPCGECKLCAGGRYNICRAMSFRSSAKSFPHAQGTLQEQISHPAAYCHKLPEGVPLELGALAEPLSVALHAGDRARLDPGATVLVLGAGAVGLLCCAVSKVLGARNVVVADINADRVRWAVDRGFADASVVVPMKRPDTVEAKLEFAREVAALVAGAKTNAGEAVGEVDATFECTGVESCLQAAIYVGVFPWSIFSLFLFSVHVITFKLLTFLLLSLALPVHTTRRQDPHHRHGQPNPDAAHLGRLPQGGRPGRRLPLRKHVPARHRAAGRRQPQAAARRGAHHPPL